MNWILRSTMTWIALVVLANPGHAQFREFASREGKFKVQLPGDPKLDTQKIAGAVAKTYSITQKDGAYIVSFADMPIPAGESEDKINDRLDGAREGMAGNIGAKITKSSNIKIADKHLGRELFADLPQGKGLLRARIYLVDRRLYQVFVIGTATMVNSKDTDRFLDSFVLTP